VGFAADFLGFAFRAFLANFLVEGDFALAALEDLAKIGVGAGFLGSEAPLDAEEGDLGEEIVDLLGSGERAGGFGEFGDEELFGLGLVGEAELGTGGTDGLGAAASGGGEMLAAGKGEVGFLLWFRFEKEFTDGFHCFAPWNFGLGNRFGVPLGLA
jgi:hypothetical protein